LHTVYAVKICKARKSN